MSESVQGSVPLAIIGMSCRLPGARNLDEFWQLIVSGGDATDELPEDVLDRELYYDPRIGIRGKSYSTMGGVVPQLPFDNDKCRLPKEVIEQHDDAHLTMCEVASDALRDASYDPFNLPTPNVGVYFGHTGGSTKGGDIVYSVYVEQTAQYLHQLKSLQRLQKAEIEEIAGRIVEEVRQRCDHRVRTPGLDAAANRCSQLVARAFGLDGPCVVVDAACASSLQALALGARSLQLGQLEMAVVGGASFCKSDSLVLFSQAQSISSGKSCPFDEDATGLVVAEGYVVLILKTLSKALADGDRIRCVIRGIGMSADGRGKSLWAPRKEGQIIAMQRAYPDSLRFEDIQYIEAHATSTQVGDATELTALAEAFPENLASGRKIPLGSVKANIGHTLETAGVAGLAKAVLAIEHGIIPPVTNLTVPNTTVPWDKLPFDLPRKAKQWKRPTDDTPRRAAVNSFGIGGLNVHAVIEEYQHEAARRLLVANDKINANDAATSEPIAVIGAGAILPGASTLEAFWQLLTSGEDAKQDAPPDRWDSRMLYDPTGRTAYRSCNKKGGFITHYEYDWRRHKIPPKQVANANPLQFMLLDATEGALRQAGFFDKDFDRDRVGVVVGTDFAGDFANQLQAGLRLPEFGRSLRGLLREKGVSESGIDEAVEEYGQVLLAKMPAMLDETGSFTSSTLASRITKTFDLKGGALAMDAGSGTGLAAIGACIDALRCGTCDMMICAAGHRSMDIVAFESDTRFGFLASGEPRPVYDADANGFVPGEGCGALLLKRLSDAQRDGDPILAALHGVAASNDWRRPGTAMRRSMDRALALAGVLPCQLRTIEAVGAPAAQEAEMTAFASLLGSERRERPLFVNSIVSQFGFMGAAHSMAAAIKAVLSASRGRVPAGLVTVNTRKSLELFSSVQLQKSTVFLAPDSPAAIGVSCGSDNATAYHAIVESVDSLFARRRGNAGKVGITQVRDRPARIVRIGGSTWDSLKQRLATSPAEELYEPDRPFTIADGARLAVVCSNAEEFAAKCKVAADLVIDRSGTTRERLSREGVYFGEPRPFLGGCAYVFPGQGSQKAGMLSGLIEGLPEAQAACRRADAAMAALGYESFATIAGKGVEDLGEDIWKTQVSVLLADSIVHDTLRQLGLHPSVVAGHSFGEYAALVCAGAWSLTDAIRCTRHRYQSIVETPNSDGCMAATSAPLDIVERCVAAVGGGVWIANLNAPDQTVLAGRRDAVELAVQQLKRDRHVAVIIKVPCPFHTPLMEDTANRFAERLSEIPLRDGSIPVVSTATSEVMLRAEEFAASLVGQLSAPVDYCQMVQTVLDRRPALVVEVGPQQVLTRLNMKNCGDDDVVFLASDVPRRPGGVSLLGVIAQADCLGCGELDEWRRSRKHAAITDTRGRILVFDATDRRTAKMRRQAKVRAGDDKPGGNGGRHGLSSEAATVAKIRSTSRSIKTTSTVARMQEPAPSAPYQFSDAIRDVGGEMPPLTLVTSTDPQSPMPSQTTHQAVHAMRPVSVGQAPNPNELRQILIGFVVEQTGYPEDIVEMDVDLEADLGIDSIKKAQLFGEVGERFHIAPRDDLSLDDFPTLNHVLEFLVVELGSRADGTPAFTPPSVERSESITTAVAPSSVPATVETSIAMVEEPARDATSLSLSATPSVPSTTSAPDADELRQILVGFVVEQTGYPEDIVEMDVDLEADLGIDSIKKAQLFGEVGERFQIAPRDDLSLDDFPTLNHVLEFLVVELGSRADGTAGPAALDVELKETGANHVTQPRATSEMDAPPIESRENEFVQVLVMEGDHRDSGWQHGATLRRSIHRELATIVDSPRPGNGGSVGEWPEAWFEELSGLAVGAEVNQAAVCVLNSRAEPLSALRTDFSGTARKLSSPVDRNLVTLVQIRRPSDGTPYLTVGRPGKLLGGASINAARLAISCEPLDGALPANDVVTVTDRIHRVMATSRTIEDAQSQIEDLAVKGKWCFGISTPGQTATVYWICDAGQIRRDSSAVTQQQQAFHQSLDSDPTTLVLTDRWTGVDKSIALDELLPVVSPQKAEATSTESEKLPPSIMQRYVLRMTTAARSESTKDTYRDGDLVCVIGNTLVSSSLRQHLQEAGCRVAVVAGFDWVTEFQGILDGETPKHLVLLQECDATSTSLDSFHAAQRFAAPFEICRTWVETLERTDTVAEASLVAVTRMGGDFGFHSKNPCFAGGGLTGLLKGIRREFPTMRVKVLDFDQSASPGVVVRELTDEMNSATDDLEVGYRNGQRCVVQAVEQAAPRDGNRDIGRGGIWVVTGGGRGVTSVVARELGRRFSLRLHLLGTAPLPEPDAVWRGLSDEQLRQLKRETAIRAREQGKNPADEWRRIEKAMELDRNLQQFATEGLQATYHACDIRDRESLAVVLQQIRQNDGPIAGVIHGAGVEAACKLVRKRRDSVAATIAAKCDGAANLMALTRDDPLEHFIGFGSTSGRFGGLGQADYSLASDLLAKMVDRLASDRPECKANTFHWPAWDEVGMAVRPESRMALEVGGMAFMPTREGIEHLLAEVCSGAGEREILILDKPGFLDTDGTMTRESVPVDPQDFRADVDAVAVAESVAARPAGTNHSRPSEPRTLVDCSRMPLIDAIWSGDTAGTHVAKILLDASKDPFLAQHRFRGKPFLPGVISFEMFAEAVGLISGSDNIVGLRDVRLVNGWSFDPKRKIEAIVRMKNVQGGVKCELVGPFFNSRGELIEEDRTYATGVVELGDSLPKIEPLDPGEPVLQWYPYHYREDLGIYHGVPFRTAEKVEFQHGGGRSVIVGKPKNELTGDRQGDGMVIACATLDGCAAVCGAYSYVMVEQSRGAASIVNALSRYRQVRLPQAGEKCTMRFFYRESHQDGDVYDFTLLGEPGDVVFDVVGYESVRFKEKS